MTAPFFHPGHTQGHVRVNVKEGVSACLIIPIMSITIIIYKTCKVSGVCFSQSKAGLANGTYQMEAKTQS